MTPSLLNTVVDAGLTSWTFDLVSPQFVAAQNAANAYSNYVVQDTGCFNPLRHLKPNRPWSPLGKINLLRTILAAS